MTIQFVLPLHTVENKIEGNKLHSRLQGETKHVVDALMNNLEPFALTDMPYSDMFISVRKNIEIESQDCVRIMEQEDGFYKIVGGNKLREFLIQAYAKRLKDEVTLEQYLRLSLVQFASSAYIALIDLLKSASASTPVYRYEEKLSRQVQRYNERHGLPTQIVYLSTVPREQSAALSSRPHLIQLESWYVRGHWRKLHASEHLGVNRQGERVVKGVTWVKPHVRGDKSAPPENVIYTTAPHKIK